MLFESIIDFSGFQRSHFGLRTLEQLNILIGSPIWIKKSQVPHMRALGKLVATNGRYGHVGSGHYPFIYRGNARYQRGHSAHLWLQAYPEHACAGLKTCCLFSHIPQVSLFVITQFWIKLHLLIDLVV